MDQVPYIIGGVFVIIFIASGLKIVRQTDRAVVERFGKYKRFQNSGITWIIPFVEKLYKINITEQLVNVQRQGVITLENLNCKIDAQVYFKVKDDEASLKKAMYQVNNYKVQIVQLAQTTLRNIIGKKSFKDVNSNRKELNDDIFESIKTQTEGWGIDIVRVELKEVEPPTDVQTTMDNIIKAEQTKIANKDFAEAEKIKASGEKMAQIEIATGDKESRVLRAEGMAQEIERLGKAEAERIRLVYESAKAHFTDQAVALKTLEVNENALKNNTKYIIADKNQQPTLVLSDNTNGVIPLRPQSKKESKS